MSKHTENRLKMTNFPNFSYLYLDYSVELVNPESNPQKVGP